MLNIINYLIFWVLFTGLSYVKRVLRFFRKIFRKLRKLRRKLRFSSKFYKLRKLKVRKVSRYNVTVKKSWNNYFVTAFSRFDGSVFEKITGAASELRGSKRSTTTALERTVSVFIKELIKHKILRKKFDFTIKTPYLSKGVKNSLKMLILYKRRVFNRTTKKAFYRRLKLRNLIMDYRISHNGFKKTEIATCIKVITIGRSGNGALPPKDIV